MEYKKLAIGALVILLVAGVAGVSASAPDASSAHSIVLAGPGGLPGTASLYVRAAGERELPYVAGTYSHGVQGIAQEVPVWQQVNSNGFGDLQTGEVSALEAFNGYLYAGTHNPIDPAPLFDGAQIFRSSDGVTWTPVTQPGFGIAHDIAPPAILDLTVFNRRLYASTGRGDGPGQIWRALDGVNWAPMVIHGFSDQDNVDITALAVYDGMIYAGVTNLVTGAQIWSSFTGDSGSWTQVAPGVPGTDVARITGFAVFDGALYAAVESAAPAQLWRSYGGAWTTVMSDGFGDSDTTSTSGMAEFAGYLYVGAGNAVDGAQLWRTTDGAIWEQAISPGFGDPNNQKVDMVFVFQNRLYASVKNAVTGIELWRSTDGTLWERANQDGFGDSNNTSSNWSNATADFLGHLYVGTSNVVDGGELWRMLQPYGVNLSPDDTLAGTAGKTVTYTLAISNSGDMADTFSLASAGNSWTTILSTPTIALAPGASSYFTVSVSIPAGTLATETDTVTITATSQGDAAKSDSANLTTTVMPSYGLILSPDQAKQGSAGQTIAYTLWITNTGNVTDTFNLESLGNLWDTQILTPSVGLPAGATGSVQVHVTIPAGALGNESDTATISAASSGNPLASDSAQLATTVAPFFGLALSSDSSLSAAAGTMVTYTLTITNTGNMADSFDLTATGQTWTTTLSTSQVSLALAASAAFTVKVAIPPGAADQETDTVTITATSQGDNNQTDSAALTTTSISAPVYSVVLSGDDSLSGLAGRQVIHTLTITNTGNVVDTFNLLTSGNNWTTTLSAQVVTLAAGGSQAVTITVSIPLTAADQETDTVTLTATSQGDGSKNDTAVLTTVSTGPLARIYLPIVVSNLPP